MKRRTRVILEEVARNYGLTVEAMLAPRRLRRLAWPRQIAMALLRAHGATYQEAAAGVRRTDHATALHAERKVVAAMLERPGLRARLGRIQQRVVRAMEEEKIIP